MGAAQAIGLSKIPGALAQPIAKIVIVVSYIARGVPGQRKGALRGDSRKARIAEALRPAFAGTSRTISPQQHPNRTQPKSVPKGNTVECLPQISSKSTFVSNKKMFWVTFKEVIPRSPAGRWHLFWTAPASEAQRRFWLRTDLPTSWDLGYGESGVCASLVTALQTLRAIQMGSTFCGLAS